MDSASVRKYLMQPTNYFRTPLPPYFNFEPILDAVDKKMDGRRLIYFCTQNPATYTDINYIIRNSKDSKYAWRPLVIMHPAFYVDLVDFITNEENWRHLTRQIKDFRRCKRIISVNNFFGTEEVSGDRPLEIINWWHKFEQESIRLAMDYDCSLHTDITDCYGSVSKNLLLDALGGDMGKYLINSLEMMNNGQYQGLPQGSILMDLVAEVVMGQIDQRLAEILSHKGIKAGYLILRYRDDYRIFTNSPQLAGDIAKYLSNVLSSYNMRLNPDKTELFDDVIISAVKPDKLYWNKHRAMLYIDDSGTVAEPSLQRHLLEIYELAKNYPNGGSVQSALVNLYKKRIFQLDHRPQNLEQLVSIIVSIAKISPRTYFVCAAILSKLIPLCNDRSARKILSKVRQTFGKVANGDYFEICLQRISLKKRRSENYTVPLCKLIYKNSARIWNSEWLGFKVDDRLIVDESVISEIDTTVPVSEVNTFSPFDSANDTV